MIAAVAWDIDGTLVDSEPRHHRALLDASRRWGVDLSDLPGLAFRGVHMPEVWTILRPRYPAGLAREEWLAAIDECYVRDVAPMDAIAGAVETVRALAGRGIPQICVSNSGRRIVDANLVALGLRGCLVSSISLDDVERGKPDPEPYLAACHCLGVAPGSVLAVEDSETGVRAALAAGLVVAAISADGERFDGAHHHVAGPAEILRFVSSAAGPTKNTDP